MKENLVSVIFYAGLATLILVAILATIVEKIRKAKKLYYNLNSDDDPVYERRKELFMAYDRLSVRAFVALLIWMIVILIITIHLETKYMVGVIVLLGIATVLTYRWVRH